jgi:putative tricarboxylic transport membrane protein
MTPKLAFPEFCVGIGMLAFAGLVGYGTAAIPQSAYAKVGPAVVPWAITAGLVFFGVLLTIQSLRGGWEHESGTTLDLRSLAWLSVGLILNLVLIDGVSMGETTIIPRVGFIVASTLMFFCTARAFGSDKPLRDGAIGFALSIIAYVGFDRVLGYQIGSGLIERFL